MIKKKKVRMTEDARQQIPALISAAICSLQTLRENLADNECLLHVDFSENYSCKYAQEVQSVLSGGSHQQAMLHTGLL